MKSLIRSFIQRLGFDIVRFTRRTPGELSLETLEEILKKIPDYENRSFLFSKLQLHSETGEFVLCGTITPDEQRNIQRILASLVDSPSQIVVENDQKYELVDKIHYGCGSNFVTNWLNVDKMNSNYIYRTYSKENSRLNYAQADLTKKHNFPSDFFRFGFAEDFLEHLSQADSLTFLAECFRTFQKGGILRLSFPGLEEVLKTHYRATDFERTYLAKIEAFTLWDHTHFYSREEIALVAGHIGFSNVEFVDCGKSKYPELQNLDTRSHQIGLNTYVELTK